MKKIVVLGICLILLCSCIKKNNLSSSEEKILNEIGFDKELIMEVKSLIKSDFKQLPAIDQETGDVQKDKYYDGIYFEKYNDSYVKIKGKLEKNSYRVFLFETNYPEKHVAVIKGKDKFDILKYRRTDGINYGLETEDIIEKVSEWDKKYEIDIIGCSRDWVLIKLNKLPQNLDEFSKEVYEFCPDIVDQGVGSIESLKESIKMNKELFLWWD
ncbi:DUF4253 domain-containing protein [Fusobacterium sp.]|uniref:DUF4253 domain-containing protein n=1 Tax=Fusobacterium sp. TaxID=68766 RepID=UPI002902DA1E|nr:DUF4253 domain-containing protein [Fusobacterium sp.]MDU1911761.1 DUF4253 domain-containing protein [Fusobacterium sp.]